VSVQPRVDVFTAVRTITSDGIGDVCAVTEPPTGGAHGRGRVVGGAPDVELVGAVVVVVDDDVVVVGRGLVVDGVAESSSPLHAAATDATSTSVATNTRILVTRSR
jgi:hypothetical protein